MSLLVAGEPACVDSTTGSRFGSGPAVAKKEKSSHQHAVTLAHLLRQVDRRYSVHMPQVKRISLADQAAALLLDRIQQGEWPVGAKLPGETTLGPELGVGRSTIREAIRQLAGRGVLQARQGAGVFVASSQPREDWDTVLLQVDIAHVVEGRLAIEVEAALLAAHRRTDADVAAMREALTNRATSRQTVEDFVEADMRLHRCIVAAAHNPVLLEIFDGFVPRVRQAMVDMLRLDPSWSPCDHDAADHDVHAQIINAIERGDPDAAGRLSRSHLTSLREALA